MKCIDTCNPKCRSISQRGQRKSVDACFIHLFTVRANLLTISESPELYLTMAAPTSGYIMSHENFNFGVDRPAAALGEPADTASYTQNDTTGLFMRLPVATTHVNFNFIHYDIGTRDELYIFNAVPDFELLYHGKGTSSPSQNITFNITANEMRFEFAVEVVDAGQPRIFSGFLLQYEGKTMTITGPLVPNH